MAQRGLEQAASRADVVLTGPRGLAVALRYDPATMATPVVVAKGTGTAARRICQLALAGGAARVEKGRLAGALHRAVDVGGPIPTEWYAPVAELLAGVYQRRGKDVTAGTA